MRKIIASLFLALALYAAPAHAQFAKPVGAPTAVVTGNITIGVWAAAQAIDGSEFVGVFQQQTDGTWNWTGLGTVPTTSMSIIVANAGGYPQYLTNVALPLINTDIQNVYYGSGPSPTPPPPGSDPVAFLNFYTVTQFAFKTINGQSLLEPK